MKRANPLVQISLVVAGLLCTNLAQADEADNQLVLNTCAEIASANSGENNFKLVKARQLLPGHDWYELTLLAEDRNLRFSCQVRNDRVTHIRRNDRVTHIRVKPDTNHSDRS